MSLRITVSSAGSSVPGRAGAISASFAKPGGEADGAAVATRLDTQAVPEGMFVACPPNHSSADDVGCITVEGPATLTKLLMAGCEV